jgi:hypothetical protein
MSDPTPEMMVEHLDEQVQTLLRENEQLRAARKNPWAHIPQQYAGRWTFDYDEKLGEFFVCCNGHVILRSEDSEVCDAVCRAHNSF